MRLFELTQAYQHLEALIDDDAENETLLASFDGIEDALKVKATNIAMLVMNIEATAEAIRVAEKRMTERRTMLERRAERIRDYLLGNMTAAQILSIECEHFKLAVRNNPPSVVIDDPAAIPTEYLRTIPQPPPVPDKVKILDDLKQGVVIDGAHLERRKSLTIK